MGSEDEQDGTVICVQPTPGQRVYTKSVRIPRRKVPAIDKLIKVGVLVSLGEETSDHEAPTQLSGAVALPNNVHVSDLPENMTLEAEFYEIENRKIMRMRIKPEPNSLIKPEHLRFNFLCNYMPHQAREDQLALPDVGQINEAKSVSSGEAETEYFSDVDIDESGPNEKGVQTDIALGELLFSDSIASVSYAEVENVSVQTYITAIDVSDAGDEEAEGSITEDIAVHEVKHGGYIENTSVGESQKEHEEDICSVCEEEKEEDEEEETEEEEDKDEEEDSESDTEETSTAEPWEAQKETIAINATPDEKESGIPLCLLRGDPPWVDPLVDTYTIMWDTNLEVAPNEVGIQFRDSVDPVTSDIKVPEIDPLLQLRKSQTLSATFSVKRVSSKQSYFGSFMALSSSDQALKRNPELFNIHIDLNTWGFPAALHERYVISASPSVATLFNDQPSLGEIIYMTQDAISMHSVYNPNNMADIEEPADTVSVGFLTEDEKTSSDIVHTIPRTKSVLVPEELQRGREIESDEPTVKSEWPKGPRSISEEYFSTVEELQSSDNSSSEDLKKEEEEVARASPNLPLAVVVSINDSRPLILLMDPEDLPISIAIGTKNVPVNSASAVCAIKKFDGNMFHINNIDLKETAITNLELEKTESDKVICNIKVEGDVKGETIADLGILGSTLLLNLPIEQAGTSRKEPTDIVKMPDDEEEKDYTGGAEFDTAIESENGAFELQWQEGLPVSDDIFPHKADTMYQHPVNQTEAQIVPGTTNEALRKLRDMKEPHTPERTEHKSGCRCKTSNLDKMSHSTPQSPYNKPTTNLNYGVLAKSLKDLEQQITPLNKALDDIKCKIQALEVDDPDILLSPVCSEDSSILSRSDSGYEQEIAELISSAQREAMGAKLPCIQRAASHIQCVCDPHTELVTPRRRRPCSRTDICSMSGYMIQQRATFNMPLDMGITCLVPAPIEMLSTTRWPQSSLYRTPSDIGCLGGCVFSPSENLTSKKPRTFCSGWTNNM